MLRPLTERILARLPGQRASWIVVWALVPWLNAGVNLAVEEEARSAVWEQGTTVVVLNYAALSFASWSPCGVPTDLHGGSTRFVRATHSGS